MYATFPDLIRLSWEAELRGLRAFDTGFENKAEVEGVCSNSNQYNARMQRSQNLHQDDLRVSGHNLNEMAGTDHYYHRGRCSRH
jgi:hypothetical protein